MQLSELLVYDLCDLTETENLPFLIIHFSLKYTLAKKIIFVHANCNMFGLLYENKTAMRLHGLFLIFLSNLKLLLEKASSLILDWILLTSIMIIHSRQLNHLMLLLSLPVIRHIELRIYLCLSSCNVLLKRK